MPKWYWKLFDLVVWCALAAIAIASFGILTLGLLREAGHHPLRRYVAHPVSRLAPAVPPPPHTAT